MSRSEDGEATKTGPVRGEVAPATSATTFPGPLGAGPEELDKWVEVWASRYSVVWGSSPRPPCC
jgi:hypothetical protein